MLIAYTHENDVLLFGKTVFTKLSKTLHTFNGENGLNRKHPYQLPRGTCGEYSPRKLTTKINVISETKLNIAEFLFYNEENCHR